MCSKKMFIKQSKKGFTVGSVIAVVIGLVMILAVAYPIAINLVDNLSLTGTDALVAGTVGTLLLVGVVVLVTRLYSA
jgi:nitrate reductase gamma subunit